MADSILVIDDDEKLNELLAAFLKDFGFTVHCAITPKDGLKKLKNIDPDLIILDVMLPQMTGFEVCKQIRVKSTVPIIMLTARGNVTDRVLGLEIGADDYVQKPFEPRELVARIQSVLRRSRKEGVEKSLSFGQLTVDFASRRTYLSGEEVELTTGEFAVLALLVRNAGKVLDRDRIIEELRGIEYDVFDRSIDITISRLRAKFRDDPKLPSFIKTVWGSGYMFIGKSGDNE